MIETVPLSLLIEQQSAECAERNEAFVRGFSRWLHERARFISIEIVNKLALKDVVITFKMQRDVTLVITGSLPDDLPGSTTISIDERDFPFVNFLLSDEAHEAPYEMCTLDYSPAGRAVRVISGSAEGERGQIVVSATIGGQQQNRVQLDNGELLSISGDALEWMDAGEPVTD